jgi:hypothetical protein
VETARVGGYRRDVLSVGRRKEVRVHYGRRIAEKKH